MNFKAQYLTMFGGSSEQDFFDMFLENTKTKMEISGVVASLPGSAIGYCYQLLNRPSAIVATDAISQIRKYVPSFLLSA